jgi:predicted DNA-binding protein (MmcQ/YjbR family)
MDVESLRKFCLSFPAATENLQWEGDLCFKVGGKIFAIVGVEAVPPSLCFKCTPESFAELCEREGIRPAPYVGRYKWVLLERLNVLGNDELRDLIRNSYEMVASKAKPKRSANRLTGRVRHHRRYAKSRKRGNDTRRR